MEPLELLTNLTLMAAADGIVSQEERTLLDCRRRQWGISDERFQRVLRDVSDGNVKLTIPAKAHHRYDYLADLVEMVVADGRVDQAERQLLSSAAEQMGIDAEQLDQLIDEFSDEDDGLTLGVDSGSEG